MLLSRRYKYDGKPFLKLSENQIRIKNDIKNKIKKGAYKLEYVSCVCSSNDCELIAEKDRYGLYCPMVICKNCGLVRINPRMTQEWYNWFYENKYRALYLDSPVTPRWLFEEEQHKRGTRILNYLKKHISLSRNMKVCEIGCSAGGILKVFKDDGFEILGVDIDKNYLQYGIDKGLDLRFGKSDLLVDEGYKADIVILSHVVEHFLNIAKNLKNIKEIVNDKGIIYIEVPGLFNIHKSCMALPRHMHIAHTYNFCLGTLKNTMDKYGFEFVCGDEGIHSLFKKSSTDMDKNQKNKNYYAEVSLYLRKMERYRLLPTSYHIRCLPIHIRCLAMPIIISFLKRVGLYNTAKEMYHKFKAETTV